MKSSQPAVRAAGVFSTLLLLVVLAGCAAIPWDFLKAQPSATPTSSSPQQTPTGAVQVTPTLTPTPEGPQKVLLWLPPQFDPNSNTPAGNLLRDRLQLFETENPTLQVQVRIKAATGAGGLLESLASTSSAAPAALPGLVALSRPDLETAALKGLVFPLDGLTSSVDHPDWYSFARQLALIQGTAFGLPFAGDALLLLYRTAAVPAAPATWDAVIKTQQAAVFPAADQQALLTLQLYLSAGGAVKDAQGRPALQVDVLSKVLKVIADASKTNTLPAWLAQVQTDSQAWQAYQEQRANLAVSWVNRYLLNLPADSSASLLPGLDTQPLTLATGWVWAIAEPAAQRREGVVKLAEFLTESKFLSQWNLASGYLPPRPSALASWSDQNLRTQMSAVALSAQLRPSNDILSSLGPVLAEATLQVIKQQAEPAQAAQAAADKLGEPVNK